MGESAAFLLQVALLLTSARLLGELVRRIGQPAVLGELAAGILLGPSVFGTIWPAAYGLFFGSASAAAKLGVLAEAGLILLMLLTGLETDARVLGRIGRAAMASSIMGLAVPFAAGLALGGWMDSIAAPRGRFILCLFLATAMAVSALPVIAKILMDLNLLRRDFGMLALTAAMLDDTAAWVILAAISGMAMTGSLDVFRIVCALGMVIVFLAAARYALFPSLRRLLPLVERSSAIPHGGLVAMAAVAFACAAVSEAMHVHAVFGAFVAGVTIRQCPGIRAENLRRIEAIAVSLMGPLFFASIGLRVEIGALREVAIPIAVFLTALVCKIAGCLAGGALARLTFVESLALGAAMSARGAVGLVVAKVGADLGIIDAGLFAALVAMAIGTTMLAPPMLRLIAPRLPVSEEERLRERMPPEKFLPAGPLRILLPAAGGPNAPLGCHVAGRMCSGEGDMCMVLHVETERRTFLDAIRPRRAGTGLAGGEYLAILRDAAGPAASRLAFRTVRASGGVLEAILDEARRGYDFLAVGASGHRHPLYDPFISELVRKAPCHVMIFSGGPAAGAAVRTGGGPIFRRILVPMDGSYFSEAAFEVAARYARTAGASICVLYVIEGGRAHPLLPQVAESDAGRAEEAMRATLKAWLIERFPHQDRLECRMRRAESLLGGVMEELRENAGAHEIVFVGAENRSFVEHLYLGPHMETVLAGAPCPVAIVIPNMAAR
ncbi:MAG: cation:proton antiporter [Planctomycetota bacterium]|nr:cation:proton antiporter [Planctomycetota bacterium]